MVINGPEWEMSGKRVVARSANAGTIILEENGLLPGQERLFFDMETSLLICDISIWGRGIL
jgi:hypothetical protein